MKCTNCGSSEIDFANNQAVCSVCGVVLEESQIVSEITFGETSGGGAVVQGSMLTSDQGRARMSGPAGFRGGFASESRELTIANARNNLNKMAGALRVPTHVADRALRFFSLALDGGSTSANGEEPKNYVLGRKAEYTTASCLYVACRMDKTTHMLIDFADAIQVNVFVLGRSYLKLVRVLNLKLPLIDPSIYISRFAALLDFGDETQRVASDASRLVSRFKKDWLTEGRRPAGICGACLLLAARMNHFRRSISEVIQVVKIADITLRNRLEEFKKTPTGQLSVQDFRNVWLEEEYNPPAYIRAREPKKERKRKEKSKKRRKLKGEKRSKSAALDGEVDLEQDGADADGEADEGDADGEAQPDPDAGEHTPGDDAIDPALESLVDQATEAEINTYLQEGIGKELDKTLEAQEKARQERAKQGLIGGGDAGDLDADGDADADGEEAAPVDAAAEAEADPEASDNLQIKLSQTQKLLPLGGLGMELDDVMSGVRPSNGRHADTDRGEGSSRQGANGEGSSSRVKKRGSEPPAVDDLGDLDEAELDRFILTPEEIKIKERVWLEFNKDWLEGQLRKQLKMEHDQKHGIPIREPYKRKKPKAPRDASNAPHQSAAESAKQMFKQKSFSKKINYDALNSLFPGAKRSGDKGGSKRKRGRHDSSDESDSSADGVGGRRTGGKKKDKGKGKGKAKAANGAGAGASRSDGPDFFPSDFDDEREVVEEDASLPSSHPLMRRESRVGKKAAAAAGGGKGGATSGGGESTADAGTDLGTEVEEEEEEGDDFGRAAADGNEYFDDRDDDRQDDDDGEDYWDN